MSTSTHSVVGNHLMESLAGIVRAFDEDRFEYAPSVMIETIRAALDDAVPVQFVPRICAEGDYLWDEVPPLSLEPNTPTIVEVPT